METRPLVSDRGIALSLAAICVAIALLSASCGGGGGSTAAVSASPAVSLSSTSISFGNQTVGSTSASQSVTLTNGGTAPLTINGIQITGTNPGDFGMPNSTCVSPLAVNANCSVDVTFAPTTSGDRSANLTFNDSASNSPQTVNLTGTSTAPEATLTPLSFGSQPGGTTSSGQIVTLTNTGNASLAITGSSLTGTNPGDFAVVTTTCGGTLAANTPCSFAISFTPAAAGSRSASLVVRDNSNNVAGSTQTAALTGTGAHDVILAWTASATSGVVGYYVYRGSSAGGESTTTLNSTPVDGTSFIDTNVAAGTRYFYVVTAVASDGITQSAPSNEVSATVPSP